MVHLQKSEGPQPTVSCSPVDCLVEVTRCCCLIMSTHEVLQIHDEVNQGNTKSRVARLALKVCYRSALQAYRHCYTYAGGLIPGLLSAHHHRAATDEACGSDSKHPKHSRQVRLTDCLSFAVLMILAVSFLLASACTMTLQVPFASEPTWQTRCPD